MVGVGKVKKALKSAVCSNLMKNADGSYVIDVVNQLPVYLEGAPGVGKTEISKQVANELGIGFISYSMTQHTRTSILGLPVIKDREDGGKYTEFTMSEIIAKVYEQVDKGFKEGILLLDEFPCMSESVMPEMLAFLQTKNIGMYTLPEGWSIVLCGNPKEYNNASKSFDAAITDRIRKIDIEASYDDFMSYAKEKGFHETVIGYLENNARDFYKVEKDKKKSSIVTCRSWENLSHTLVNYEELAFDIDYDMVYQFIKDEGIARKFIEFYIQNRSGLLTNDFENIINGIITPDIIKRYSKIKPLDKMKIGESILECIIRRHNDLIKNIDIDNIVNAICKKNMSTAEKQYKKELKDEFEVISSEIDNAFSFVLAIDASGNVAENMYYYVNDSELLLRAVCARTCGNYIKICKSKMMYA